MIRRIVDFALRERWLVAAMTLLLLIWGVISFIKLPVEAYPDVANNWVQVITQWPGRAAEEVEQQVTIPVETQMAGLRDMTNIRSVSTFGLSIVTIIFDDDANDLLSRQQLPRVYRPNGGDIRAVMTSGDVRSACRGRETCYGQEGERQRFREH